MKLVRVFSLATIAGFIALSLLGNIAFGQNATEPEHNIGLPTSPVQSVTGLVQVINNVVKWVYILFFILAVLFIIFAAFTYLTSGGDPTKVTSAKNSLIYAAVAIAVALLAVGFRQIIATFLTAGA